MSVVQFPGTPPAPDNNNIEGLKPLGQIKYVAKLGEVLTQEQAAALERRKEEIERKARERL